MHVPQSIRSAAARALLVAILGAAGLGCGNGPAGWSGGTTNDGGTDTGSTGAPDGGAPGDDSGGGASEGGTSEGGELPALLLPIEVLGNGSPSEPTVASTTLPLAQVDIASVANLYVQCHRCGFYGPPEFEALSLPLVTVKASLRIDGGASGGAGTWIDITDANVQLDPVSLAHGGINGGLFTTTFKVPVDDAARSRLVGTPGLNTIEFRFNGTDGGSNGYRILDVQFQDAGGRNLSPVTETWADISAEKAAGKNPSVTASQGQALWTGRKTLIKSTLVPRTIRAACSDCHAADGRDLQYFNYSDNSIVQRSRFHGLTQAQGESIAAFLRSSLYGKVADVPSAAPWNPPFQPGPGLDSQPVEQWSAGAGLAAVLPDGAAFVKEFVGQPVDGTPLSVTQAEITAAMDITKVTNTRETRLPIQFPDWNAWLPVVHPLDVWAPDSGQTTGLFEQGYNGADPLSAYTSLKAWLDMNKNPNGAYGDWSNLSPNQLDSLQGMLQGLGGQATGFGGGGRGTRVSPDPSKPFAVQIGGQKMQAFLSSQTAALADLTACGPIGPCTPFNSDSFIERADLGLYHWMIIKQWELVESYGLQAQQTFHGSVDSSGKWVGQGEVRGWPYSWPSVFYVAPHMLYAPTQTSQGSRDFYFSWENRLVSYYRTDAWYALQVTVNPGWAGASNGPIDWPYTQGFIAGLADDLISAKAPGWITAAHMARYFEVNTKLAQLANTNIPFDQPNPSDPTNIYSNAGMQSKADLLFKLAPAVVMDPHAGQSGRFRTLDQIAPGTYVQFLNASIAAYGALYFGTTPGQFRVCDPSNMQMGTAEEYAGMRFCIDASRTPLPTDSNGKPYCPYPSNDGYTTEQFSVWGVTEATNEGADPGLVQSWNAWNNVMWP
jgi:hypothetical protein